MSNAGNETSSVIKKEAGPLVRNPRDYLTLKERLSFALQRGRGITIETDLTQYKKITDRVLDLDLHDLTDAELSRIVEHRGRTAAELTRPDSPETRREPREITPLVEMFAAISEACRRVLGLDPFAVQLIAGLVMSQGKLAQMRTGEGKTLAAVFPAVLYASAGLPVHVMTANEYLASRDAEWMGRVYELLGLRAVSVTDRMSPAERRKGYEADVVYLTAKQAGFDYLVDGLCYSRKALLQRELGLAIVDEADFIMIDEARIPLVIASESGERVFDPYKIAAMISRFRPDIDYVADRDGGSCRFTHAGSVRVEKELGSPGIHVREGAEAFAAVHVALHAHTLLSRDVDYVVSDGRIEMVDEFTGRIAHDRRWPYGIQTALEAKEGLPLQSEGRIRGMITIHHFLSLYPVHAAMTATATPAADEFVRNFGLPVVVIPPNRPDRLLHLPDRVYPTHSHKEETVVAEIAEIHASGRPILVGTTTVAESARIADMLHRRKIPCGVLNAKNHKLEAGIITHAGRIGAVTVSTNMAGRGTDIRLGGPDGDEYDQVAALGGLHVIGMNRHESRRIDDQLAGRAGRQGDPGSVRFFLSLEDDLVRKYGLFCAEGGGVDSGSNTRIAREIRKAQEVIEDRRGVMKRSLRRYSEIVERQRRLVREIRMQALIDGTLPDAIVDELMSLRPDGENSDLRIPEVVCVRVLLLELDDFWADHLAYIDDLREGIHLRRYAGKNPLLEYIRDVDTAFHEGLDSAYHRVLRRLDVWFDTAERAGRETLIGPELEGPSSTWTYMINEEPLPRFDLGMLMEGNIGFAAVATLPRLLFGSLTALGKGISRAVRWIYHRVHELVE